MYKSVWMHASPIAHWSRMEAVLVIWIVDDCYLQQGGQ